MITYCHKCTNVHEDTRKLKPWYWLCTRHPNLEEGYGFVTDNTWDDGEPFLKCRDVNKGACPLFEERKE